MKILFSIVVLLSITNVAFADTKFSLGGGFNFNTFESEETLGSSIDKEISTGLVIAGKAEVGIDEKWLFRTGLWLQEKSAKLSVKVSGAEADFTFQTIYASIPVTVQYQASPDISIFGGYVADFRINDYCDADGDVDDCYVEENSKSVVHLATAGVSILGSEKFNVDLSWQHGLSDVYSDAIKIHTFQAMIFYKLQ